MSFSNFFNIFETLIQICNFSRFSKTLDIKSSSKRENAVDINPRSHVSLFLSSKFLTKSDFLYFFSEKSRNPSFNSCTNIHKLCYYTWIMILFHCINMNHFHPVLSRLESCVQKTDFLEIILPHLFLKHRQIKLGKNRIKNMKDIWCI